jgi:hypothetical protein
VRTRNRPELRLPLNHRQIRRGRVTTRTAAVASALSALAVAAAVIVLANGSGNADNPFFGMYIGLILICIFAAGVLSAVYLWERYSDISREACALVFDEMESLPEFSVYRAQVLEMERQFVWADLRALDKYKLQVSDWDQERERDERLSADCLRLYSASPETD